MDSPQQEEPGFAQRLFDEISAQHAGLAQYQEELASAVLFAVEATHRATKAYVIERVSSLLAEAFRELRKRPQEIPAAALGAAQDAAQQILQQLAGLDLSDPDDEGPVRGEA